MKHLEVVGAIICNNKNILAMQRGKGKYDYASFKFEFPGGKIEKGESKVEALKRELKEEMDIEVSIKNENFFAKVFYEYPDFSITMHAYFINVNELDFKELEHVGHCWVNKSNIKSIDWLEADISIIDIILEKGLI